MKVVGLAQCALPQADRFRISKWGEFVKEDDLLRADKAEFIGLKVGLVLIFAISNSDDFGSAYYTWFRHLVC